MLFVIFGIASFLQWSYSHEIKNVSEYHRFMSIPALTALDEIKLDFQMIHMLSIQMIQTDVGNEKYLKLQDGYQKDRVSIEQTLEKYNNLSFVKNMNGEFIAPESMQTQMRDYVIVTQKILENYDEIIEQYQKGDISHSETLSLIVSFEDKFHKNIETVTQMEIKGMENTQFQIIGIENEMFTAFTISSIVAVVTAIIVIILTSKFVSIPINRMIKISKLIAKGETVEFKLDSKNSDVNDISIALDKMSKDLEEYKTKVVMQEKLSSIGELASRLAHDIKNPLTVIKVTLDMIKTKNKNLTLEEIEKFERVDTAMYRITHQIDNVLDFIKGKPLKFKKYPIQDILDSVITDLPKSNKISIEIISEDVEIECDFEAMKVILINLTINAIQAIKDNEGRIKISSKVRGDNIFIEIEDNGPGIPKEILEKIFEPLYTTKEEGTGLGLVSCKSLVNQHHGKISVKTNPTRFIIELPKNIQQKTE